MAVTWATSACPYQKLHPSPLRSTPNLNVTVTSLQSLTDGHRRVRDGSALFKPLSIASRDMSTDVIARRA